MDKVFIRGAADPVLPLPSHRHPMSGEPIWDEAAARACYEKARADLIAELRIFAGHSSLADMIAGHIPVWRKALEYCRLACIAAADRSYYDHEIKALEAIDAAMQRTTAQGGS